jgi:hypothetical protein
MHRVYNSAFMKHVEERGKRKYRDTIKNTLAFDPEILKRYVNFMNNPDGKLQSNSLEREIKLRVCTMMVTMLDCHVRARPDRGFTKSMAWNTVCI